MSGPCKRSCPQCGADNHIRKYSCDGCGYFWPRPEPGPEPTKVPELPKVPEPFLTPDKRRDKVNCLILGTIIDDIRRLESQRLILDNEILRKNMVLDETLLSLSVHA